MPSAPTPGHDIIVIGASLGGVDALRRLVAALPADLPASVFVVLHISSGSVASTLPDTLTAAGPLRAVHAIHGAAIERGVIYVAPPDNHLMVRSGALHVVRGPKENGHRPAVDTLFRSAARAFGPRVVGVVLTGGQDCGTGGLLSIKARGGIAVVQDPNEADAPDMPSHAIAHVDVDHVLPVAAMGALLARLARSAPGPAFVRGDATVPRSVMELEGDEPGAPAELVCPMCQGVMKTSRHEGFEQFRCHTGHTFSLADVAIEQAESLERALWAAARALEESASLSARLAGSANGPMQKRFAEKEQTQREHAELLRRILFSDGRLSTADELGVLEQVVADRLSTAGKGTPMPSQAKRTERTKRAKTVKRAQRTGAATTATIAKASSGRTKSRKRRDR